MCGLFVVYNMALTLRTGSRANEDPWFSVHLSWFFLLAHHTHTATSTIFFLDAPTLTVTITGLRHLQCMSMRILATHRPLETHFELFDNNKKRALPLSPPLIMSPLPSCPLFIIILINIILFFTRRVSYRILLRASTSTKEGGYLSQRSFFFLLFLVLFPIGFYSGHNIKCKSKKKRGFVISQQKLKEGEPSDRERKKRRKRELIALFFCHLTFVANARDVMRVEGFAVGVVMER
ncbi:MAG: hypothetical protein J3R72DRAFT_15898 [Linnemannia gamsii]|nr:MAG: hypothetical protein J3R72DRAFT_15898 [Linnemannia gamsii]